MFRELYPVAKHTPLNIIVTPAGDRLRVLIVPKPDKNAKDVDALSQPIEAIGTPEELDAELPAAIAGYAEKVNDLRTRIDVPIAALDQAKKKERPTKAAKPAKVKKAKKPAAVKAIKPKPVKVPKKPKAPRPHSTKATRPAKAAKPPKPVKHTPTPRSSLPGKDKCLEDLRAYMKTGKDLARAPFIDWARGNGNKTGRRFEKLWKGWNDFYAEGKGTAPAAGDDESGAAQHARTSQGEGTASTPSAARAPDSHKPSKTVINPAAKWPFPTEDIDRAVAARRRTVHTDTGVLLGNVDRAYTIGEIYTHADLGEFRVVKVADDRLTVQRVPETAEVAGKPPANQQDLLKTE